MKNKIKLMSIFGTRPEAIKMAPLVNSLSVQDDIESVVCTTGQHSSMLRQVLDLFNVKVDFELGVMVPNQTLNGLSARLFSALDSVLTEVKPDRVLVHGDTTTAQIASLAAYHRRIPVGHVEAGLRTGDLQQPWPEEMNRRVVDVISDLLFAPTESSKNNLMMENIAGKILITGNTVIDALLLCSKRIASNEVFRKKLDAIFPFLDRSKKLLLVTGHRRENLGDGFENICKALARLSLRPDIQIVYPVHLNPNVRETVNALLSGLPNVYLIEPLDYLQFVRLMQRAHVVLTDSGGVQEEAPSLGKPVLVMRDVTERPEAVQAGTVRLVGTNADVITGAVNHLYDDNQFWHSFAQRSNPYGDGGATERIIAGIKGLPVNEFMPEYSMPMTDTLPPPQFSAR